MKRFRLSTLMLLIVIAALCVALVVQHDRAARREAELQAFQDRFSALLLRQPREDPWEAFLEQQREREELAKRELAKQAEALRRSK